MGVSVSTKTVDHLTRQLRGRDITARFLNQSIDAINTMVGGATPPFQTEVPPQPSVGAPAIDVALVRASVSGSSVLRIRRVKYEAEPPVEARYAWDGEAFDGYLGFGTTPTDFAGLEWLGPLPVIGTVFLEARQVDGFWLVSLPLTSTVAQFRYVGMASNFIGAHFFDGINEASAITFIAKPYTLRKSTFHERIIDGIEYRAVTDTKRIGTRVGTDPPKTETQVIVKPYLSGDLIYATTRVKGGVDVSTSGVPLLWIDDNRDSRDWAGEFPAEEA